ncbi:TetR family transcriptional regulator [Microlunatus ginsengisoli]|uniref:TetR family transcriptional regulator n=1 Tax=Microlunatus ginsengisoli TaxID=363863 RepID=UPI0031E1A9CE
MGRAEQAERTRAALLLAAAAEFEQRGFAATSLTDVSDRLGLVRATVHFHFATKKALAQALVAHLDQVWHQIRDRSADEVGRAGSNDEAGVGLARLRWESEQVLDGYRTDARQRAGLRLAIEPELAAETPDLAADWVRHVGELLAPAGRSGAAPMIVQTFAGVVIFSARETEIATREIAQRYWAGLAAAVGPT